MSDLERLLVHPVITRLARALEERPGVEVAAPEEARRAAVALLVRVTKGKVVEVLLIQRASYQGDPWSGHVALPGGRHEPEDQTLWDTAARETLEEIGIDLRQYGRALGALDDLQPRTPSLPPLVVRPFVVLLTGDHEIVLSSELTAAFWVPLSALEDPAATREVALELESATRKFSSFQVGQRTVWGLTERILRQFLSLLP
ncbi:MAG: CoA pyrophosphatase [Gemmatimonadaceae bacterium]